VDYEMISVEKMVDNETLVAHFFRPILSKMYVETRSDIGAISKPMFVTLG